MKFYFSIIFLIFFSHPLLSNDFEVNYEIRAKGIKMGSLNWKFTIKNETYNTSINLKNEGILSSLYSFEGKYSSFGKIKDKFLYSDEYNQRWKTKKKEKIVKIIYKNKKIKKLFLFPTEKEFSRVDYKKLQSYNDPLTSFLNIIISKKSSYTIDGRRTYLLKPVEKNKKIKVLIENYINIWADHKRNNLEGLEFYQENIEMPPNKIKIKFDGIVFNLVKI